MRVARQNGGKSLYASFDGAEPAAPKRACIAGTRDSSAARLNWRAPDNGGADIKQYRIFLGTRAGSETLVGKANEATTTFDDASVKSTVGTCYYVVRAVSSKGVSAASNEIAVSKP
jgi:hypothetical protein